MNAMVSVSLGEAVLLEDSKVTGWVTAENYDARTDSLDKAARWMAGVSDIRFLNDCTANAIQEQLRVEGERTSLFTLFMILLDADLSDGTREIAAQDLEEALAFTDDNSQLLNALLFSQPLPDPTVLENCRRITETSDTPRVLTLLDTLEVNQPQICQIAGAWATATAKSTPVDMAALTECAIRQKLFLDANTALHSHTLGAFHSSTLTNSELIRFRGFRETIGRFIGVLPQDQNTYRTLPRGESSRDYVRQREANPFLKRSLPLALLLERAEKQKTAIIGQVKRGNLSLADKFTSELIRFQKKHDRGSEFLSASLCHLAVMAKRLGRFEVQCAFTQLAVDQCPDNGWAWVQHADALGRNHRFDEAFAACDLAVAFNYVVVGNTVKAVILATLLRFDEALSIYDVLAREAPNDPYLYTARAETYKAMGLLNKSLVGYDEAIGRFPDSTVARSGRADVLKLLGRHSEALKTYDTLIADCNEQNRHDDELEAFDIHQLVSNADADKKILRNARASVLKSMGDLSNALKSYSDLVAEDPYDVFALMGQAGVLKIFGRYDDALSVYDRVLSLTPSLTMGRTARAGVWALLKRWDQAFADLPQGKRTTVDDWIAHHVRGMVYLRQGNVAAATDLFAETLEQSLPPTIADYFRNGLALCRLRRSDYGSALVTLEEISMPEIKLPANIIKAHVLGEAGRRHELAKTLGELRRRKDSLINDIANEFENRYISHRFPRRTDEWIVDTEIRFLLAA